MAQHKHPHLSFRTGKFRWVDGLAGQRAAISIQRRGFKMRFVPDQPKRLDFAGSRQGVYGIRAPACRRNANVQAPSGSRPTMTIGASAFRPVRYMGPALAYVCVSGQLSPQGAKNSLPPS